MKLRNVIFFVKDINKSLDFYQKLGFSVADNIDKFANLRTEDENIYFSISEPKKNRDTPGNQVCAFSTNNVDGLYEKFKLLSTPLSDELKEGPMGKMFAISDPDGNKIMFIQNR